MIDIVTGIGLQTAPDMEELPVAVPRGCFKAVSIPNDQKSTLVMFDLETTKLSKL